MGLTILPVIGSVMADFLHFLESDLADFCSRVVIRVRINTLSQKQQSRCSKTVAKD